MRAFYCPLRNKLGVVCIRAEFNAFRFLVDFGVTMLFICHEKFGLGRRLVVFQTKRSTQSQAKIHTYSMSSIALNPFKSNPFLAVSGVP